MIPVLETERLRLRAWRESDLDAYAGFCANETTTRFLGGVCKREEAWRRIAMFLGHWTLRGFGNWVIEDTASGAFAGYAGLWQPEGWPEPELMWGLAARAQHQGYATEAAHRIRDFAYRNMNFPTLISLIVAENAPSLRVAARLGAMREHDIELRGYRMGVYRHPGPEHLYLQHAS